MPDPVLPPAMASYCDALILRNRAHTARTTAQALVQLAGWLAPQRLDPLSVTAQHLGAFQQWLVTIYKTPRGNPLARSTVSTRMAQIAAFYRWCQQRGLIAIDPATKVGIPFTKSRVVVREHLSVQEATALIQTQASTLADAEPGTHTQAEARRNLAILCLALATGRRIGGMTTLLAADVDVTRSELRVEREKGHVGRVLPVAAWAMRPVADYLRMARPMLARGHDAPWLFLNLPGTGPITRDALRWLLDQVVAKTIEGNPDLTDLPGKRISWHSLRVSFATMLFANGCDIRTVNELMLHRRLSTTARYTPVPIEDLRQVFRTAHPRP